MKKSALFIITIFLLMTVAAYAGSKSENDSRDVSTKAAAEQGNDQQLPDEAGQPKAPTSPVASEANLAGEEINWQVVAGGGSMDGISTNFRLSGTVGQTAVGGGTYGTNKINHGFWQVFASASGCCDTPGDANNDGTCNIGDAVYLVNFVFASGKCITNPPIGCPPECTQEGDANADASVNVGDIVYLNNYVFRPSECATNPPIGCAPQCGP